MPETTSTRLGILRHTLFLRSEQFIATQARAYSSPPVLLARDPIVNPQYGLRSVSMTSGSQLSRVAYMMSPDRFIRSAVRSLELSVLHAHFGVEGEASLSAARDLGIPHFTTLHGYDVSLSAQSLLASGRPAWIRYALRRRQFLSNPYTTFICVSEHVRVQAKRFGADERQLVVVHNGVDLTKLRPTPIPDAPRILHIARLVEKKGTRYLIKAMKRIRAVVHDAVLDIVGDGPLRAELEALVAAESLTGAVTFHGAQEHDRVLHMLRDSRVLCVPSVEARSGDQEGLPQVIPEASALGRPVVGTRHSGIPEAIEDGVSGLLIDERDERGLSLALISILEDTTMAAAMGVEATRVASERFDVSSSAAALEHLYASRVRGTSL